MDSRKNLKRYSNQMKKWKISLYISLLINLVAALSIYHFNVELGLTNKNLNYCGEAVTYHKEIERLQRRLVIQADENSVQMESILIDLSQRLGLNDRLQPLMPTALWKSVNGKLKPSKARQILGIHNDDVLGEFPTGEIEWEYAIGGDDPDDISDD